MRRATDGQGVDHAVEVVGALGSTLQTLAPGGEIAFVGFWLAGPDAMPVEPSDIFFSGCRLRCVAVGSRAQFGAMNREIELGGMRPVVDRVFAFEDAREAYRHAKAGRCFGRVVINHG